MDHIKAGDDHSDSNLQSLCREHHKAKTNREAHLAFMAQRREQRARIEREFGIREVHPGSGTRPPYKQPWEVA